MRINRSSRNGEGRAFGDRMLEIFLDREIASYNVPGAVDADTGDADDYPRGIDDEDGLCTREPVHTGIEHSAVEFDVPAPQPRVPSAGDKEEAEVDSDERALSTSGGADREKTAEWAVGWGGLYRPHGVDSTCPRLQPRAIGQRDEEEEAESGPERALSISWGLS
ncbi:hypothetical protein HYPSUDRAFT_219205 [Hypholoma sublateritium FD-334 SS-4]|uniref:Uncharacterized protein n=1 Tax=Hypholoma sublateritium (strain FD-334 SS-4) TaxID=945553 RepID=A0A0D2NJW7_HYPSF|nr:hypothetical protein HYPSUDRAFT_219205 [Hypholoma sublateritium FD-334 SS-4]